MDVTDLAFRQSPLDGRTQLAIQEKDGREISAYSASDGTLRFLAILAVLLDPEAAPVCIIEEIENSIHPSRLHLLVDLIETQIAKDRIKVIATTHSPNLLSAVGEEAFENASVVFRPDDAGNAIIRPVSGLPNVTNLWESQGLGRLLTGNWMETALAFKNGNGGTSYEDSGHPRRSPQ